MVNNGDWAWDMLIPNFDSEPSCMFSGVKEVVYVFNVPQIAPKPSKKSLKYRNMTRARFELAPSYDDEKTDISQQAYA